MLRRVSRENERGCGAVTPALLADSVERSVALIVPWDRLYVVGAGGMYLQPMCLVK